jgi:ribokinase
VKDTKAGITVVGSCMMDMIVTVERMPTLGETLTGDGFHLGFGGKGANQAVMASLQGANVQMIARVGGDVFGKMTLENFGNRGIDTRYISTSSQKSTGVAPIFVQRDSQNLIVVVPGANDDLSLEDVQEARSLITQSRITMCQLEVPQVTISAAFTIAKEAGVQTILNPAPASEVEDEILIHTDLIIPNEVELSALTNMPTNTLEAALEAARILQNKGPQRVIVTLGANGALLAEATTARHFPSYQVAPIDTTGAGDAFIGALAAALCSDRELPEAIAYANAAAALSTIRPGTQISFPTQEEVEAFVDEHPAPRVRALV